MMQASIGPKSPRVAVILVNWRGWRDTLLALETLFASDYQNFDAVVVDNDSGDESVDRIVAWAKGSEHANVPESLKDRVRIRSNPHASVETVVFNELDETLPPPSRLTVIRATCNGGFAGGNNVALKYLMKSDIYGHFWLLNNDAFPSPDALAHLLDRAIMDERIGMVGSTLVFAGRPDVIQALGGAEYQRTNGRGLHIGAEAPLSILGDTDATDIESRLDYVVGASLLVSRRFLEQVGLMEESYFLYFEEIDWAERGKAAFKLGYAKQSLVYHKAGGSTQAYSRRTTFAAYYLARNRMLFTQRFYAEHARAVLLSTFFDALRYTFKARWSEARGFARAVVEALSNPKYSGKVS